MKFYNDEKELNNFINNYKIIKEKINSLVSDIEKIATQFAECKQYHYIFNTDGIRVSIIKPVKNYYYYVDFVVYWNEIEVNNNIIIDRLKKENYFNGLNDYKYNY